MEVRKIWQHFRVTRFAGLGSRRLATTMTSYAAVPPNDGVGMTGSQHGQLSAPSTPRGHGERAAPAGVQHGQLSTHHDPAAPGTATRRVHLPAPGNTAQGDVIDDTVTSWIHNDDARHGCHGYGDVSEVDDEVEQQQQQDGGEALCMTRLDVDRH